MSAKIQLFYEILTLPYAFFYDNLRFKHLLRLLHHLLELVGGVFFLAGKVKELLIVSLSLLTVFEDIGIGIGNIKIGGDGRGIISQMLLPCSIIQMTAIDGLPRGLC